MTMTKLLHWIALRMSSVGILLGRFGEWLWECGGGLECWCDSRAYRRKWMRWAKDHKLKVRVIECPKLEAKDLSMPMPGEYPVVRPRPLTLLDEGE